MDSDNLLINPNLLLFRRDLGDKYQYGKIQKAKEE